MKRYIVGFTFRYTESNEDYYCVYEENEYEEYKKFFCETCVGKDLEDIWFSPEGEEGDPGMELSDIQYSLENAVEITPDVEKALHILYRFLPSKKDVLFNIKRFIVKDCFDQ